MRKETIVLCVMILIIAALIVSIALLAFPSIFPQGLPAQKGPDLAPQEQPDESSQQQNRTCPTSLGVYYIVDRKGTQPLPDDDIFVAIRNPDDAEYKAKLYIDSSYEGELTLLANTSSRALSGIITGWWRAGNQKDIRSFPVELKIEGCSKTLSELMPTLPVSQEVVTGGGGGGGQGQEGGSNSPEIEITIRAQNLPD